MTTSDWRKVFKQLKVKPDKLRKYKRFNKPKERSCGKAKKSCRHCGRNGAHISKYGIAMCRQCFRDLALKIGFKKYN